MSEIANSEGASETEKPVFSGVKFPPFPEPAEEDFDDAIPETERAYYKTKFEDLNTVKNYKLHCTACDRHMGCSARNERIRVHPMLNTLICHVCHAFYNSGEFEKGDDGSELYCRWCGQGGQVYCCSDCPHVFCAKCIKRNLGSLKIKEIENADDWKCFKCNPDCLIDLRAVCWAVLRYVDMKRKVTSKTQDPELKAAYEKDCALDPSECCKHKSTRKSLKQNESSKKKDIKKESDSKNSVTVLPKVVSTIQVKKFASVNVDETTKSEKKAQKRPASPKPKSVFVKNPVAIAPKVLTPVPMPPFAKKIRFQNANTTIRYPVVQERKQANTYTRVRPPKLTPIPNNYFNGFPPNMFQCSNPINDNINLSLESLTQGLDMAAVAALSNTLSQNDDVVCTPDFPLEPMCEVTEDNDDDVQCITPASTVAPKNSTPTPLPVIAIPRNLSYPPEVTPENIIQMTENDVTVNASTGGLKFRVDPQTLSSNKMYRLPDGRIFAINPNPNMPGGYSATIVAVTEGNKAVPKEATFAAKLSSVSLSTSTPKANRNRVTKVVHSKHNQPKVTQKQSKTLSESLRECDMNVPVEWYRYNLIDAIDAVEYSLTRLRKLKKEATSVYLRTRSVNEMRSLHRTLERLLNTASIRFNEIRDNLNKGLKEYASKKDQVSDDEDDDDVEILPDMDDDPIFIDENSSDSNCNGDNQEVDLTGPGSSEYNDSGENRTDNLSNTDGEILDVNNKNDSVVNSQKDKHNNDKRNKLNSVENRQKDESATLVGDDLKCDESFDKEECMNNKDEEVNKLESNTNSDGKEDLSDTICDREADTSDETIDRRQDVDRTSQEVKDEVQNTDIKAQDVDNNTNNGLKDAEVENADDEMHESNNKVQDNKVKTEDDTIEDLDIEMKDADNGHSANCKTLDNDKKSQEVKDEMQDSDDKIEDVNDKVQDTEMSDELIENLLKDDSVDNITTSSDAPTLQVT